MSFALLILMVVILLAQWRLAPANWRNGLHWSGAAVGVVALVVVVVDTIQIETMPKITLPIPVSTLPVPKMSDFPQKTAMRLPGGPDPTPFAAPFAIGDCDLHLYWFMRDRDTILPTIGAHNVVRWRKEEGWEQVAPMRLDFSGHHLTGTLDHFSRPPHWHPSSVVGEPGMIRTDLQLRIDGWAPVRKDGSSDISVLDGWSNDLGIIVRQYSGPGFRPQHNGDGAMFLAIPAQPGTKTKQGGWDDLVHFAGERYATPSWQMDVLITRRGTAAWMATQFALPFLLVFLGSLMIPGPKGWRWLSAAALPIVMMILVSQVDGWNTRCNLSLAADPATPESLRCAAALRAANSPFHAALVKREFQRWQSDGRPVPPSLRAILECRYLLCHQWTMLN